MTTFTAPAPQVERDRWGRPLILNPDTGKKEGYRRVTTFIDVLDSTYNLSLWQQRMVATGMSQRPDLVLKASSANGDKKLLDEVAEAAREAGGATTAATTGTALHSLTEQLDKGMSPLVPPSAQPDIDAYQATTSHLKPVELEVFVVHDALKIGGTFDRIVELDGVRYVADIKTGRIDYGSSKIAMQLAAYADAQYYEPVTGERAPLNVDPHRGLVIHLPAGAGECSLHWADLDQGREGLHVAAQVWAWRGRQGLLEASHPTRGVDLYGLIELAGDADSIRALWAQHPHSWTDTHTEAAKKRISQLTTH